MEIRMVGDGGLPCVSDFVIRHSDFPRGGVPAAGL